MRNALIPLALIAAAASCPAFAQASAAIASGKTQPSPLAPSEIVGNAPKADWTGIAASDLLVMDLAPDAKGPSTRSGPRRVVIQLMPPPFSQGWIGNIRKLAAAKFWDGTSVNRVQDNYVVQWGDATEKKPLPEGLAVLPESEYAHVFAAKRAKSLEAEWEKVSQWHLDRIGAEATPPKPTEIPRFMEGKSSYALIDLFENGWPFGVDTADAVQAPAHCYGMVGVGRDLSPNTGSGAELYTVIGHAPRHLDRNIALVGRVIEGIEHLSSLPRGTGALGFYESAEERVPIVSVRIGTEVKDLPSYEFLSTESASFAAYADARANRRDAFFIRPAGGADVCNIPVPVRRVK